MLVKAATEVLQLHLYEGRQSYYITAYSVVWNNSSNAGVINITEMYEYMPNDNHDIPSRNTFSDGPCRFVLEIQHDWYGLYSQ